MRFIYDEDGECLLPVPQEVMAAADDPLLVGAADILDVCDVHPLMLAEDGGMKSFSLRMMERYLQRN